MKTIRRIYFYLVTAISVELLAWGVVNLLRSIFRTGLSGGQSQSLSIGLAQILVSIPIFIVHWLVVQKDSDKSEEEQTSLIRAMYLYGILLGTLVPVVQNILAFVNRLLLDTTGVSRMTALVGRSQTLTDNLIAIGINLILAAYFYSVLKKDWQFNSNPANLIDMRRVYWYFWMLYGLGMTVLGIQQLIQFMLRKAVMISPDILAGLLNPITLLVLGVPIWVYTWMIIQQSITQAEERNSSWRVGILYFLIFAGAISTAVAVTTILGWILRWVFGETITFQDLIWKIRPSISYLVPLSVIWVYFIRHLRWDIESRADVFGRQAMIRVYRYILAFLGLAATITGLIGLLGYVVDYFSQHLIVLQSNTQQIAQNLALLLVGLIYWLFFFFPENRTAQLADEFAEHSRRSLTRKIYLYTVVFGGVVGVMVTLGTTLFVLLDSLFSGNLTQRSSEVIRGFSHVLVFAIFLSYHLTNLRRDSQALTRTLAEKHASFPVAIATSSDSVFGKELVLAFSRHAPSIPIRFLGEEAELVTAIGSAKAVVLPSSAVTQSDSKWLPILAGYAGRILSVAETSEQWEWIPQPGKLSEMAKSVAITVRNLAEGRLVQAQKSLSVWAILGYILAGLLVLMITMIVLETVFGG